tara:strand:- start:2231 stop:3703 length:1473 start_codon:yes stop_codon:yes gene_type:complete
MADVSFNIANPYQTQLEELARRQKMAEIMQQQAFQPIERSSYQGIEAPISPLSGIAKALQMYMGGKAQRDISEEKKALGEQFRTQSSEQGKQFIEALKGTPGQAEIPVPSGEGFMGGEGVGPGRPAIPAKAPDMARALELSMSSVNPMVQGAGGALLTASLPKASKWEKVELPTPEGGKRVGFVDMNSPNPEATFRLGGQQGPKTELANIGGSMIPRTGFEQNPQPIERTMSPDTKATLAQSQALADRAFNNLSAAQQAQDRREAQRLGVSIQQFNLSKWQAENPSMSFQETEGGAVAFNPKTGVATPVMTTSGMPLQGGKPLTEFQGKATGFASRAGEADQIINSVGKKGEIIPSLIKSYAGGVPVIGGGLETIANLAASPAQQQVEQAQRNFVNAILRQESGASIAPSEFASAQKQYFPQLGDSPEVIKQKTANRQTAINALKVQSGPGMQRMPQQQNAASQIRARNPTTGEERISTDGGNTWQPAGR